MPTFPGDRWMRDFAVTCNEDPELALVGKHFNADVLLEIGEARFLLAVREGKVRDVLQDPAPLTRWDYALRASREAWERFILQPPPPMFHDLFAMLFQGHMVVEGDTLALMQNLHPTIRMLECMRMVKAA